MKRTINISAVCLHDTSRTSFCRFLGLLFVVFTAFLQQGVWAAQDSLDLTPEEKQFLIDHPVIRVTPDPDFPPFEWFDEDGQYSGITSDYVAIFEKKP